MPLMVSAMMLVDAEGNSYSVSNPLKISPSYVSDSVSAAGGAAAPAASAVVAGPTAAVVSGGIYEIVVDSSQGGTVDAVNAGANMQLVQGATVIATILSTAARHSQKFFYTSAATAGFSVTAIGNAGASSQYNASIVATRVA